MEQKALGLHPPSLSYQQQLKWQGSESELVNAAVLPGLKIDTSKCQVTDGGSLTNTGL